MLFAVSDTLTGVRALHLRPETVLLLNAIVPTKLSVLVTVMLEIMNVFALPLGDVTLSVKSPTWTTDDAEWEAVPGDPAPPIVTRYVPGLVELNVHEVDAVAFAVRLVAVAGQVTVKPVVGLMTKLRLTVPTKLKVLVRLTEIAAPVAPVLKLTGDATENVKSPTWTTDEAE